MPVVASSPFGHVFVTLALRFIGRGRGLLSERPFRSLHHTVSDVAMTALVV